MSGSRIDCSLVVVQCRLNSKRLPGKALYPLAGLPMLVFLLKRLRDSLDEHDYPIVLATTRKRRDDLIAEWGISQGVAVIRGEEEDVLSRYNQCLDAVPAERVVRVTADNPLTCPRWLKWSIGEMNRVGAAYVQTIGLPVGAGVDAFSADLLRRISEEAESQDEREHINLFVLRHRDRFKTHFPRARGLLAREDVRMTVDTYEDWKTIGAIFTGDEHSPWTLSLKEAIARLDQRGL
jgi:spore coat polysaccharide biosynthesis protein SpsF